MFALYDDQREALIRLGTMLAVGACAVLPFTLSPSTLSASAEPATASAAVSVPAVPGRIEFPTIAVSRDPFVPDQNVLARNGIAPDLKMMAPAGESLGSSSLLPIVRAVVTGDEPRALIENGGTVQVLAVGDKLGVETIASIDASGVTLSSGIRLVLVSPR